MRELKRYNIDIAALSETRRAGEGQLTEHGEGYTFFWKGKDRPRIHGVRFAIKNYLVDHLDKLPSGIIEKEEVYYQLDTLLTDTPRSEKPILLGDFNARVGRDCALWTGTIGKEDVGNVAIPKIPI